MNIIFGKKKKKGLFNLIKEDILSLKKPKEKKARQSTEIRYQSKRPILKIGIQEVMVTMIPKLQS